MKRVLMNDLKDPQSNDYLSLYDLVGDKRLSKLLKTVYIPYDYVSDDGNIMTIIEPENINIKYLNSSPTQFKYLIKIIEHGLDRLALKINRCDFHVKMYSNRIGWYSFLYDAKERKPFQYDSNFNSKGVWESHKKHIELSAFY